MDPKVKLDLKALMKAGACKTGRKQITITTVQFSDTGVLSLTDDGWQIDGPKAIIELEFDKKTERQLKQKLVDGKVKATVIGDVVQKTRKDPDNADKKQKYLVVSVTNVEYE